MFCSSPFSGGVFNSRFAVAAAPGSDSRSLCARRTGGAPGMLPGCALLAQHGALPPCSIHGGCSGVQWGAARPGLSPSEPPATPPPPGPPCPCCGVLQRSATKPEMYWK